MKKILLYLFLCTACIPLFSQDVTDSSRSETLRIETERAEAAERRKREEEKKMMEEMLKLKEEMKKKQIQQMVWMSVIGLVFMLIPAIFYIISWWKLIQKAGGPGWSVLIPVYNNMVLAQVTGKPATYGLLTLIPIAGIVFYIMLLDSLVRRFGKSSGWTVGVIFLPIIFVPILAFSRSIQVEGHPDTETKELDQVF